MSMIHNEQIKLSATYLNQIAIAIFVVGSLGAAFSVLNNDKPMSSAFCMAVYFTIPSLFLHSIARWHLRRLKHDDKSDHHALITPTSEAVGPPTTQPPLP